MDGQFSSYVPLTDTRRDWQVQEQPMQNIHSPAFKQHFIAARQTAR